VICITAPDAVQEHTSIQAAELLNSFTACCKGESTWRNFATSLTRGTGALPTNLNFLRSETKL
jgi:hypothetical protein